MESYELITNLFYDAGFKVNSWSYKDEIIVGIQQRDRPMSAYARVAIAKNSTKFVFACHRTLISYDFNTTNLDEFVEIVKEKFDEYQKFLDEEFGKL